MFLADKVGQKVALVMHFIFTSVILTITVIPFFGNFLKITVGLGRFVASQTLTLVWVFIPESFPVAVRANTVGIAQTLGKVPVMVAPFLVQCLMHISKLSVAFITMY